VAPHTPLPSPDSCPHERRPGTKFCLHCRHEARLVAKERRRRLMLRGSELSAVLLVLGSVGTIGAVTLRRHATTRRAESPAATTTAVAMANPTHDSVAAQAPSPAPVVAAPTPASATATSPAPTVAVLKPIVPEGTTTLVGGITATRHDSVVVLSFDFAGARTRLPERFERLVRTTLPSVYGAPADSAIRAIPDGGIVREGDLFTELSERGVRIPLSAGGAIALYPILRPGRDGPLVTQYRVTVTKS
jgi:hypothetical protein